MRKATTSYKPKPWEIRATFVAPRALVDEFRLIAKRNQRSLSAELRQMMQDRIAAEQEREAA